MAVVRIEVGQTLGDERFCLFPSAASSASQQSCTFYAFALYGARD